MGIRQRHTLVATPSTQISCRSDDEVNCLGLEGVAPIGPAKATLILTSSLSYPGRSSEAIE